jgi:hypothetical protein
MCWRVQQVRVASASPADRVLRLSAIEARVQQLPDKYIGTNISIETRELYDSGHHNISHIGIQVAGWTSSIAIRQKSLKQRIQPPTASTTLKRALLAVTRALFFSLEILPPSWMEGINPNMAALNLAV